MLKLPGNVEWMQFGADCFTYNKNFTSCNQGSTIRVGLSLPRTYEVLLDASMSRWNCLILRP